MSRMQMLLKNQEERSCQILARLEKMETRLSQDNAFIGIELSKTQEKLALLQEHLTSHRIVCETGATPKTPPVPKRMAAYLVEFMQEPVEVRHRVYHFAKAKRLGVPNMEQTPQYEELIQKYDVPEFLELLQEILFRAIV